MKISSISNAAFCGVYVSNSFSSVENRRKADSVAKVLRDYKVDAQYEKKGQDILLSQGPLGGIRVDFKRQKLSRLLDDNFSRWSGKID